MTCSVCHREPFARGYCHTHYYRLRNGLDMTAPVHDKMSESFEDRFRRNVEKTEHGWEWIGAKSGRWKRYGGFTYRGERWWAHRAAWSLYVDPIPEGFHIDHDPGCPGACVTVAHLRCLSPSEHMKLTWARGEMDSRPKRGGCSLDGCDRLHAFLGYCSVHARRLKRTGSPLGRSGVV